MWCRLRFCSAKKVDECSSYKIWRRSNGALHHIIIIIFIKLLVMQASWHTLSKRSHISCDFSCGSAVKSDCRAHLQPDSPTASYKRLSRRNHNLQCFMIRVFLLLDPVHNMNFILQTNNTNFFLSPKCLSWWWKAYNITSSTATVRLRVNQHESLWKWWRRISASLHGTFASQNVPEHHAAWWLCTRLHATQLSELWRILQRS